MEQRLFEVLSNRGKNYILPFFWQHGESRELLREGMERIYESGIRAVCVESRPHPDFAGEGWWRDLDVIIEKAKELGMRVWVLDDAHFPSGYCNGKVTDDSPYGKVYLTHYGIDVSGPRKGCSFMIRLDPGEKLVGVTIGRRYPEKPHLQTQLRDITKDVRDGRVFVDIPEGLWCVSVIKTTRKGTGRKNYINTIDRDAVRFFIDQVYEPHYAHYAADFGGTFAGFFSDEPEIGNCGGEYVHDANIGIANMRLPWSKTLEARLRELWGERFACSLMMLWSGDVGSKREPDELPSGPCGEAACCRRQFMELAAGLYGENFCGQIGDWCRAHGVEYIGHVIEDGGTHAHLGLGTGHFFEALWGQDMSGIDVVLQEIRPKLDEFRFHSIGGNIGYHGSFFHYGLAKLGVSLGHLDPKKKGRTMCEVFGAYGWSEGLKLMKWIIDHMLVNGVNCFVPHAFTMKDFPDPDCPPHFYARGMNPQFPYFKNLMEYCNRVSHLLTGGAHVPCAAVLYTAEQEWMGDFVPFETVGKVLTRNQIDFEVLPTKFLLQTEVTDGFLRWGNEQVNVLIVPGSRYISDELAEWLARAQANGLKVIIYGKEPECAESHTKLGGEAVVLCEQESLIGELRRSGACEYETAAYEPWLRYYHYRQDNGEYVLLHNGSDTDGIRTTLRFVSAPSASCWYDAWNNTLEPCRWDENGRLAVELAPYEMKILYCGEVGEERRLQLKQKEAARSILQDKGKLIMIESSAWTFRAKAAGEQEFGAPETGGVLGDYTASHPWFSGVMRYETAFAVNRADGKKESCMLELGDVYETAHVLVNGKEAGVRVAPPYCFEIGDLVRNGENTLAIEVVNTLVNRQRDSLSMTMPMEPSGLIGPVRVREREAE